MNDSRLFEFYPTRENMGLKTHSEASYNAIEVGCGSKGHQTSILDTIFRKWYLNCG